MIERLSLTCLLCCVVVVFGQYPATSGRCQTPAKLSGSCVLLTNCPSLMTLLQPATEANIATLRQSHCGFEGDNPKVCCPDTSNLMPKSATSSLLPDTDECGATADGRIVGGVTTKLNEYPWMTLVEYRLPNGRGFRCGGSLINNRYVLTAAHCLKKIPASWTLISVRLGEHNLDTAEDCQIDGPGSEDCADPPIDVAVEEKIVHEGYSANDEKQSDDIALLRLKNPVSYTRYVKPVCLPTTEQLRINRFANANLTVCGWGRTENQAQSNVKMQLQVPVKSDTDCVKKYFTGAGIWLTDNQMCAGGEPGKDSCTGDSGGPLMYLSPDFNWYAIGVVSFGPDPCGMKGWPGIYTRVAPYMPWIVSKLRP